MARRKAYLLKLSDEEYAAVRRVIDRERALYPGRRVTMADVLRDAILARDPARPRPPFDPAVPPPIPPARRVVRASLLSR